MLTDAQRKQLRECSVTRKTIKIKLALEGVDEELHPMFGMRVPNMGELDQLLERRANTEIRKFITGWERLYDTDTGCEIEFSPEDGVCSQEQIESFTPAFLNALILVFMRELV